MSVLVACLATSAGSARAAPTAGEGSGTAGPRAVFALIIGVNASLQADVAPLRFADDDAARYLDLFRALGARTYLLSRLDANTRRLHPQAAAESVPPRRAELREVADSLARDIARARSRGVSSTLYVIYAGHGDTGDAGWYLTLEDERLSGQELLAGVVDHAGADQTHVIIDACQAYLLAMPRGPGGTRRPIGGFVELEAASRAGRIGFLLASSASGESHEWAGFEAGVFSHEVRSGLYGAADADGDGVVTYAEIGAFVARANEAIKNERFRPQVLARAPSGGQALLDLRGRGDDRELVMAGSATGAHYLLENGDGVRLLDFHGTGRSPVRVVRPPGDAPLYLRRPADGAEWVIPRQEGPTQLDALPTLAARAQPRGAAHDAFGKLFTLAFDDTTVAAWANESATVERRMASDGLAWDRAARNVRLRRAGGIAALGLGVASGAAATAFELSAHARRNDAPANASQLDIVARNGEIDARNRAAMAFAAGAIAAGTAGLILLLWPQPPPLTPELSFAVGPVGCAQAGATWRF